MTELLPFVIPIFFALICVLLTVVFFLLRERAVLRRLDSIEAKAQASDELYQSRIKTMTSIEDARREDLIDLRERVTSQEEKIAHLNSDLIAAYQQNALLNGQLGENIRLRERLSEDRDDHRRKVESLKSALDSQTEKIRLLKFELQGKLTEVQKTLAIAVKYDRPFYDGYFFEEDNGSGKSKFLQIRDEVLPRLLKELNED